MSNSTASTLITTSAASNGPARFFNADAIGPYDATCEDSTCLYCNGPETD
ncbi:hypothetical protein [Arthrobacter sp. VKM Ac-2550]|nr:hypothetical protein [Arthrobacter sp. VKM Ac-2550]MCW2135088.1 hypothetical protein [Arthrobacter sp. VKM Ac-2550]